jgi:hypothetical protein
VRGTGKEPSAQQAKAGGCPSGAQTTVGYRTWFAGNQPSQPQALSGNGVGGRKALRKRGATGIALGSLGSFPSGLFKRKRVACAGFAHRCRSLRRHGRLVVLAGVTQPLILRYHGYPVAVLVYRHVTSLAKHDLVRRYCSSSNDTVLQHGVARTPQQDQVQRLLKQPPYMAHQDWPSESTSTSPSRAHQSRHPCTQHTVLPGRACVAPAHQSAPATTSSSTDRG